MKIIVKPQNELSALIVEEITNLVNKNPHAILGLATGSSPLMIYSGLIKKYREKKISFKDVTTFNLDEYIGLDEKHPKSYRYFMNNVLFDHVDINKDNTYVPKGTGDYVSYMNAYDDLIASKGGIDIQILGVGSDGHIGFNEPYTPFSSKTHIAELAESTIVDNSRFFKDINEVPTESVTMGLSTIMKAKKIVLIATGKKKANAIYNLVKGLKTEAVPCSILQDHNDVTIYCDEEAYSMVKNSR